MPPQTITALSLATTRYTASNPLSQAQHALATSSLPGGNTRTLLHTSPFPLTMSHGAGPYLYDLDSHNYLDLTGDMSAGLYGHTPPPPLRAAINSVFDTAGVSLGATTALEQRYAALLCERFGMERVRMCNSGTEANLYALTAVRKFTGKKKIVVFAGGYHGGVLSFPGTEVGEGVVDGGDFVVVPRYNDVEAARRVIEEVAGRCELAGVLVEAVQGAGGVIPGEKEFLKEVREAARRAGGLFVLDEVMTSRLAPGGLGREMGLEPDLVTLGKYLGGGFAFGAFGGREEVMRVYDPRVKGGLGHSGTFNNNTMAMSVGFAGLKEVFTAERCGEFNKMGDRFRERLAKVAEGTSFSFTGRGSLIGVHCTDDGRKEIKTVGDLAGERTDLKDLFWFEMLEKDFWIARRGFMALILDTPEEELDRFVDAVVGFLERHRELVKITT
ncbi:hypothetical protein OQA88_1227 [Cercophora sp. LCS_1]